MFESNKAILILDSEAFIQELLRIKLGGLAREVLVADDEKEAKKLLLEREIELIILDLMHPRLDAYRFVQWLKNHPELSRVKIIILTFKKKDPETFFLYNVWIEAYFEKPFLPDLLLNKVKEIIKGSEAG